MRFTATILALLLCTPGLERLSAAESTKVDAPKSEAAKAPAAPSPPKENNCIVCHGEKELWVPERPQLFVTEADLSGDIHWQKGLRCYDCHGGNPETMDQPAAHAKEAGFRTIKSPADVPEFCGTCHANVEFMRRYTPAPRTDQLTEYWTSGHGLRLKATGDAAVATCTSCHDKPHGSGKDQAKRGVRPVAEPASLVYRTRVAQTCAKCHSDKELMKGRLYHGQPLAGDEYEKWSKSVHGKMMLEKGDLSAPTCNNCHGNHGAVPPQVDSVANVCGTCHGKVAKLFSEARMKHKFESEGLPGCVTCHSNHDIAHPTDEMLGMSGGAVCVKCHVPDKDNGKFGATIAGAETAKALRGGLENLKHGIALAEETLTKAETLGMEVSQPRFDLRRAFDALTNARSQIHTFQKQPVEAALGEGEKVVTAVQHKAQHALEEYTSRRIWLAVSLVPILFVIGLLLLYIRSLPAE